MAADSRPRNGKRNRPPFPQKKIKKKDVIQKKIKKNDASASSIKSKTKGKKDSGQAVDDGAVTLVSTWPALRQLEFLLGSMESAAKTKLSPLEREAYSESCMVELSEGVNQDVDNFSEHIKAALGAAWKEDLCDAKLSKGVVDAGSPAVLIISTSALRCLELLRGLKQFTDKCRAVKLFAKHLKVEEQVGLLKARVNIACGTPSRINKLIDMEALSLARLKVVVLDLQKDAKSLSLFTLLQVREEFWDLYKAHLEKSVQGGSFRICFYGAVSNKEIRGVLKSARAGVDVTNGPVHEE